MGSISLLSHTRKLENNKFTAFLSCCRLASFETASKAVKPKGCVSLGKKLEVLMTSMTMLNV